MKNERSAQFLTHMVPAETGSMQVCGQVCRNLDTIYIPANRLRISGMHLHSSRQIPSGWRAEPEQHRNQDTDGLQTSFVEHNRARLHKPVGRTQRGNLPLGSARIWRFHMSRARNVKKRSKMRL